VQKRLKGFVEAGQLGIFANGYWGHPAYKLPPEANLMAVAHYLEALAWQRDAARLHAIFGGKNPHPNFVVGGVASPIDLNSDSAINAKKLAEVQTVISSMLQPSSTRSMCRIPSPSPASTRIGRRAARGLATSCASATCRP
jgi:hydrogenase large subunit